MSWKRALAPRVAVVGAVCLAILWVGSVAVWAQVLVAVSVVGAVAVAIVATVVEVVVVVEVVIVVLAARVPMAVRLSDCPLPPGGDQEGTGC